MDFKSILLIARLERKILRRDPIFCVIAFLGLAIIFILQFSLQGKNGNIWYLVALPSSIPFVNTLLFIFFQIFLTIIATSEWRQTTKRCDTLESLRTRPTSNTEFILGKTWGIITTILIINVISIGLALLIHLFDSYSTFQFYPYVFYFFTLSIPSLVFLTGITSMVSGLVKPLGLSILSLYLLFIGSTAFFPDLFHGLADFRATILPNVFSDVTGHVGLFPYLIHRTIYLVLGIAGIIYAIAIEQRLPNRSKAPTQVYILGSGGIILIVLLGIIYHFPHEREKLTRIDYRTTALKYHQNDHAQVEEHEIILKQEGNLIIAKNQLKITNKTKHDLDNIILYLNPGLKVICLEENSGNSIKFTRENQILKVKRPLPVGDTISIIIKYEGNIDESVCYLDIDSRVYQNDQFMNCPLHFEKRYAYIDQKFMLLTPECYWYPVTIPIINLVSPYSSAKDFTRFHLKVMADNGKTVISQGEVCHAGDTVLFHNKNKLQGLSLCAGEYEKRSILVDSLLLELYSFKEHFHFKSYFEQLPEEELRDYLRELKKTVESSIYKKPYPFHKFSLVETPVSFTSNHRPWTNNSGFVQPEILFFPERWITNIYAVHPKIWQTIKKDQELKSRLGDETSIQQLYLRDYFTRSIFRNASFDFTPRNIFLPSLVQHDQKNIRNPYNTRAMFFDFSSYWHAEEYPVINKIMYYLTPGNYSIEVKNETGYKAIELLSSRCFKDLINDPHISESVFHEIIRLKVAQLVYFINSKTSSRKFYQFLENYKTKNAFQKLSFESFLLESKEYSGIDLASILPDWYNSTGMPSFRIKDFTLLEISDEDTQKFQMKFKIYNNSNVDGIISTRYFQTPTRFYLIPAGSCWEINEPYDNSNYFSLNLGPSSNIPNFYTNRRAITIPVTQGNPPGIYPCDLKEFSSGNEEIIVDNEDDGFKLVSPSKKLLSSSRNQRTEKKYVFKSFSHELVDNFIPTHWTYYVSGSDFYGETKRTATCKLAGKGNSSVEWSAEIDQPGIYEIFIFDPLAPLFFGKKGPEQQHYTLTSREGEKYVILDRKLKDNCWVSIGEFYLDSGKNKITLSDKGSHPEQIIVADAVKWKFIKE